MSKVYHCSIEVRGYELDSFGHVNNSVYMNYCEHARWSLLKEEGITLETFQKWDCFPVIAKVEMQYLKPTYMGQVLDIRTQIVEQGRTHFSLTQEIYVGDAKVCAAKFQSVTVNGRGRPIALPEPVKNLFKPELLGAGN